MGLRPLRRQYVFCGTFRPLGFEPNVSRFHGTRCLVMSRLSSNQPKETDQRPPEPSRLRFDTVFRSLRKGKNIGVDNLRQLAFYYTCLGKVWMLQYLHFLNLL